MKLPECSTPFGICDFVHQDFDLVQRGPDRVLNAFRHL